MEQFFLSRKTVSTYHLVIRISSIKLQFTTSTYIFTFTLLLLLLSSVYKQELAVASSIKKVSENSEASFNAAYELQIM